MRKVLSFALILASAWAVLAPTTYGALLDTGGGRYYDTSTGMYQNADGSIKSPTSDGYAALVNATTQTVTQQQTTASISPLGTTPANNCVDGTETILANGSGQCQTYINSKLTTISFCTGTETSGPCRPERIDAVAAATSALNQSRITGQTCTAQMVGFPGVDPNTGLSYYYNIACSGGTEGGTGTTGGSTGGSTGIGGSGSTGTGSINLGTSSTGGSISSYISSLNSIMNSFITLARNAQATYGVTVTGLPSYVPPTVTTGTGSAGTNHTTSCYVFTRNLSIGATGKDVGALTTQLKKEGFINEVTEVFDTKVANAVVAFQNAHKTEILTILGLSSGTGIVGEKTLAYLNSVCVNYPSGTSTGTGSSTGQSCTNWSNSGIQNGKYRYTFTKNSDATWNVTLNNPAYGLITDSYYVKANYSFKVTDKADLNRQNQGRFNYLITLPGTLEGNTEYANLFGSFNNAYYDWDNMVRTYATCTTGTIPQPTPVLLPPSTTNQIDLSQVRYVRVSVADWDTLPLALREIVVLGNNNVVLQPKVITATDYDGIYYLPGNLIDGNENTVWRAKKANYTCTSGSNPCEKIGDLQVVTLDLGQVMTVDRIKVVNMGLTETRVFIIEVSKDGNSYTQIAETRARIGLPILDSGVVWGMPKAATTVGPIQY